MAVTEKAAAPQNSHLGRSYKLHSCEAVDVLSILGGLFRITEPHKKISHNLHKPCFILNSEQYSPVYPPRGWNLVV